MLSREETQKALEQFSKTVVKRSRYNLTRKKSNASSNLYKSINSVVKTGKNSIQVSFDMEYYGRFQDEGVDGKKKKYGSKYSYKDKMPPASVFDKWTIRKGIAPRDKGRFASRKNLNFAIAKSIFLNGIKPTYFFKTPFEQEFNKLPDELVERFGLDVENFLKLTLQDGIK